MFWNLPPQLVVLFASALPVIELRGGIPLALAAYHFSPLSAFLWAVAGNTIPVIFLLYSLGPLSEFLSRRSYFFNRFFAWLFERTRRKHTKEFEIWGSLALILFVAIPLPMTGGWTGAAAAFVFGIPFKKALPLIVLGIIIAGMIITLASLGVLAL